MLKDEPSLVMALPPLWWQARVPSTPLPSSLVDLLGPTANHMLMALCSPHNVEGGGEWDNGSINVQANMASIWAIVWDILAQEFWGQEFSVMASENGAVE